MSEAQPYFLVTVDTEGDNIWQRPREITTRNAETLPRFQALCERHGFRPTYLVDYEMCVSPAFQELGRQLLAQGAAEIGMHLHAWNSPPLRPLTADDFRHQPYLAEYPEPVLREKVKFMTGLLEDTFGSKMVSHRAGRWRLSAPYARALADHGYKVDCSVTPHISWRDKKGDPRGEGGADYSLFPELPYFMDLDDPGRPGDSTLLELPVTVLSARRPLVRLLPSSLRSAALVKRAIERLLPSHSMIPDRYNTKMMPDTMARALRRGRPYVQFAVHSSELMAGGSPSFPSQAELERLYEGLDALFEAAASRSLRAATLAEYRAAFDPRRAEDGRPAA